MFKIIIKNSIMWLIPLAIYVFQIVLVSIKGSTLSSNICAWVCCILLLLQVAIPSIIRVCKSEIKYNKTKKELDETIKKFLEEDNE